MSVGVLLITHPGIGSAMLSAAEKVLGFVPARVEVFELRWDNDLDRAQRMLTQLIRELDHGAGVLVLTDLYGATPSNLAAQTEPGRRIQRVAGLNLAMLIKVLNASGQTLPDLADVAVAAGTQGVRVNDGT